MNKAKCPICDKEVLLAVLNASIVAVEPVASGGSYIRDWHGKLELSPHYPGPSFNLHPCDQCLQPLAPGKARVETPRKGVYSKAERRRVQVRTYRKKKK